MVCDFQAGENQYRLLAEAIFHDPLRGIREMLEEICHASSNASSISLFQTGIEERLVYTPITLEYGTFSIERRNEFDDDSPYATDFSVVVERDIFVRAFYTSIIDFYLSGKYDSKVNEAFTLQEIFEQKFHRSILSYEVMETMLSYNKKELEFLLLGIFNESVENSQGISLKGQFDILIKIATAKEDTYNDVLHWWDFRKENFSSDSEKKETLIQAIQTQQYCYGFRLTGFRSKTIENFLLDRPVEQKEYDDIYFGFDEKDGLKFHAHINGEKFFEQYYLDIFELWNSIARQGEFQLFVCSCSAQGCAGIYKTPKVTIKGGTVIWDIFEPQRHTFRFKRCCLLNAVNELKVNMLMSKSLEAWKQEQYLFKSGIDDFLKDFFIDECWKL